MELRNKRSAEKMTYFQVIGIAILIFLAGFLLWRGNANSNQATSAIMAQVYFDGEYWIGDGT